MSFEPFIFKKTGENEYVAMDIGTYGLIEGVKGLVILCAFIFLFPCMLFFGTIYFVYKCTLLCEARKKSKILAFIPGYNLYMVSDYACGSGILFPVYLLSLFFFLITAFIVMGKSMSPIEIFMISGSQILLNGISMCFNYKLYNRAGNLNFLQRILTFLPQLTCVMAFLNYIVAVLSIKKPKNDFCR